MIDHALNCDPASIGETAHSTRILNQIAESRFLLQFIDCWIIYRSRNGDQRSNWSDVHNISRLQTNIFGFVALDQQIIKIEVGDAFVIPSYLDVAQRSLRRRAPRTKDCIDQST